MRLYLAFLHVLLLAGLWMGVSATLALSLLPVILFHAIYCCYHHTSVKSRGWISGLQFRNQQWLLECAGTEIPVTLRQATVWRWLVVMNFYGTRGGYYPLVLFSDSTDRQQLRRLKVVLRHLPVYSKNDKTALV